VKNSLWMKCHHTQWWLWWTEYDWRVFLSALFIWMYDTLPCSNFIYFSNIKLWHSGLLKCTFLQVANNSSFSLSIWMH
jgi:hypothetical protein